MKKIWNHSCRGQKTFRPSVTSAANKRRCIWRGAKDLTFTIKTYMDIYVLCLDILYIFLSVVVLKKNMFNRLNINIFMIAGLLVGIVFEVLLNFGQASMSDYFNLKAFLLFIILQVSLINAGNYLLKTF